MPSWTSTLLQTGISGSGAVTNTTGKYRLAITTIPAQVGVSQGNPDRLHRAGWIYWSESFGYVRLQPIVMVNQTFIADFTGAIQFGWWLAPGVVANLYRMDYV